MTFNHFFSANFLSSGPLNGFDVCVGEVGSFNPAGLDNCEKLFEHIR